MLVYLGISLILIIFYIFCNKRNENFFDSYTEYLTKNYYFNRDHNKTFDIVMYFYYVAVLCCTAGIIPGEDNKIFPLFMGDLLKRIKYTNRETIEAKFYEIYNKILSIYCKNGLVIYSGWYETPATNTIQNVMEQSEIVIEEILKSKPFNSVDFTDEDIAFCISKTLNFVDLSIRTFQGNILTEMSIKKMSRY